MVVSCSVLDRATGRGAQTGLGKVRGRGFASHSGELFLLFSLIEALGGLGSQQNGHFWWAACGR